MDFIPDVFDAVSDYFEAHPLIEGLVIAVSVWIIAAVLAWLMVVTRK